MPIVKTVSFTGTKVACVSNVLLSGRLLCGYYVKELTLKNLVLRVVIAIAFKTGNQDV